MPSRPGTQAGARTLAAEFGHAADPFGELDFEGNAGREVGWPLVPCMGNLQTTVPEIDRHVAPHGELGAFLASRYKEMRADHFAWSRVLLGRGHHRLAARPGLGADRVGAEPGADRPGHLEHRPAPPPGALRQLRAPRPDLPRPVPQARCRCLNRRARQQRCSVNLATVSPPAPGSGTVGRSVLQRNSTPRARSAVRIPSVANANDFDEAISIANLVHDSIVAHPDSIRVVRAGELAGSHRPRFQSHAFSCGHKPS